MSEETEKNPLELFMERMEHMLEIQEEKNNELNKSLSRINNLLQKNQEAQLENYNRLVKIVNQTPFSISDALNNGLKEIDHRFHKMNHLIKGVDDKLFNSIENATSSISGIELSLNENDRKALADTEIQIKKTKSIFFVLVGIIFLSLLTTIITIYSASNFYKTSVLSKEEMRQNVLDDIQHSGQEIYSQSYIKSLENERKVIEVWKNANPNDSKSYLKFRNQVIKDFEEKGIPYFKTLSTDETSDGFGKKFKKGIFE